MKSKQPSSKLPGIYAVFLIMGPHRMGSCYMESSDCHPRQRGSSTVFSRSLKPDSFDQIHPGKNCECMDIQKMMGCL